MAETDLWSSSQMFKSFGFCEVTFLTLDLRRYTLMELYFLAKKGGSGIKGEIKWEKKPVSLLGVQSQPLAAGI